MTISKRIRLAAFDLDGTLIRGDTVCEVLAGGLGKLERMRELERDTSPFDNAAVKTAREEMATWYGESTTDDLTSHLVLAKLAPGAIEGINLLKSNRLLSSINSWGPSIPSLIYFYVF